MAPKIESEQQADTQKAECPKRYRNRIGTEIVAQIVNDPERGEIVVGIRDGMPGPATWEKTDFFKFWTEVVEGSDQ